MGYGTFIARRLLLIIPVFFGVTFLTFVLSHVVVKNPALAWAGERASPATIAAIAARYHLRDPLYLQYYYYMAGLLKGDWGISPISNFPVLEQIGKYFPATLELAIASFVISLLVGIPLGVISALRSGKRFDNSIRVLYLSGIASPPFLVALGIQLVFSYYFHLLPSAGRLSPTLSP